MLAGAEGNQVGRGRVSMAACKRPGRSETTSQRVLQVPAPVLCASEVLALPGVSTSSLPVGLVAAEPGPKEKVMILDMHRHPAVLSPGEGEDASNQRRRSRSPGDSILQGTRGDEKETRRAKIALHCSPTKQEETNHNIDPPVATAEWDSTGRCSVCVQYIT